MLEEGKNPGLGIRSLHKEDIDGRDVGIAIIDQPALKEHREYTDRILRYEAVGTEYDSPEMHGTAVASIAVGRTCGVAPKSSLYYFAVPTWSWLDNDPWSELLTKIIELNGEQKGSEKIRVVSISMGAFSERVNFNLWQEAVNKAERHRILVITCDPTFLKIGTLRHIEGKSPEEPSNYERGRYFHPRAVIWVPAANRTIANQRGRDAYAYDRMGGMSWTVPYLAGLAAMSYQVDPKIEPRQIVELWLKTAVKTDVGSIINPTGFIEEVRRRKS